MATITAPHRPGPSSMKAEEAEIRQKFGLTPISKVGEGARSYCWAVSDPKTHELLLLKHVRIENEKDVRWVEQLESEHQIASRFDHPSIRGSRGMRYHPQKRHATDAALVMDFVDGIEMQEWATLRQPSLAELLDVFIACADALNHMHVKGFAHADMKPINVLIEKRVGTPMLIDLGQACPLNTVKERVQGTPGFIAPEQVRRQAITYLTDVFNFGATMYFMLAHRKIETLDEAGGRAAVLPPPPAIAAIPPQLSNLVVECCAFEPLERPKSMKFVRDALRAIRMQLPAGASSADAIASSRSNN